MNNTYYALTDASGLRLYSHIHPDKIRVNRSIDGLILSLYNNFIKNDIITNMYWFENKYFLIKVKDRNDFCTAQPNNEIKCVEIFAISSQKENDNFFKKIKKYFILK